MSGKGPEIQGAVNLDQVGKWRIKILCDENPSGLVRYEEDMWERTMRPVLARVRTLAGRTSQNTVNGNHYLVLWQIARWNKRRGEWQEICKGKSKLRKGHAPV